MPIIDKAYPRLKPNLTTKNLDEYYSPTLFELTWAEKHTRTSTPRVGLLVLLKAFQRLGYFPKVSDIPSAITAHIGRIALEEHAVHDWGSYDTSSVRDRHMQLGPPAASVRKFTVTVSDGT